MKSLMMIGGGVQQVRAIELAHALGYSVLVTDRNSDCPCATIADDVYEIDGRDIESLVALALRLKLNGRIDGVFTFTELVTSVAAVAEACELVGSRISASVRCQDKGLTKDIWQDSGLATPRGAVCYGIYEAEAAFAKLTLPLIVKPTIGSGGYGMSILSSSEEIAVWLEQMWAERAFAKRFVIEEVVTGTSHDVNGLFDRRGRFHPYGIVDRTFLPSSFVEESIIAPTTLTPELQAQLYDLLETTTRSLGLSRGPVKGDAILSQGVFTMLEVAPRLHGPKFSLYAMPAVTKDYLGAFFEVISGGDPKEFPIEHNSKYFKSLIVEAKPGRVVSIAHKAERTGNQSSKSEAILFKNVGDTVHAGRSSHDAIGYVMCVGASREETSLAVTEYQATIAVQTSV